MHVMDLASCSRSATCLISRTAGKKKQDLFFEIEQATVSWQNTIFRIGIQPAQWVLYSATLPKSIFCSLMTTTSQKVVFYVLSEIWQQAHMSSHPKHYSLSVSFK